MACSQEEWETSSERRESGITFKLCEEGYEGDLTRSAVIEGARYDRVEYYIIDADGELVENIKSKYDSTNGQISVEGLHSGQYSLLVLGIRGDETKDRATINTLQRASDVIHFCRY